MRRVPIIRPTHNHPCGYFDDRQANNDYLHPDIQPDVELLSLLNLSGFRRSGVNIYRPACPDCQACISVRIPAQRFQLKRRFRRVLKALRHWRLSVEEPDMRFYPVYDRYISARHSDGSMYPPSTREFHQFLIAGYDTGRFLVAREKGQIRAVLVFDQFNDGLSSVYCFFDPDYSHLSPGIFMITRLTQMAQMLGLPYHYLGYWVNHCGKMSYKQDFSPLQYFIDRKWQELSPNEL